ncbi:type I restriction enzyme HsdR N-terminal domain-containing protein [Marinilabiliaceae bacterium ANBcel2]|nr:type I restriction enzyme HsdR N-terminal domain-containing protein [Marinilabiliaceae bacterium ANBcel2]
MQKLNLPSFKYRLKVEGEKSKIFDPIRKKFVVLTPEEWVRQHFLNYMTLLNYPPSLIAVEKLVTVNNLKQRADIVMFNKKGSPVLIVECKAPTIKITDAVLNQAARYNISLGVKYLTVTNGITTYCIKLKRETNDVSILKSMPNIEDVNSS